MDEQDYEYFKRMDEQTIASSNAVLRSLILVNGGAAVAVLAFVGSLAGNEKIEASEGLAALTYPLVWFGWGVAIAVASMILAYFTHYFTAAYAQAEPPAHKLPERLRAVFHFFGILTALGSLIFFLIGMYEVRGSVLAAFQ